MRRKSEFEKFDTAMDTILRAALREVLKTLYAPPRFTASIQKVELRCTL